MYFYTLKIKDQNKKLKKKQKIKFLGIKLPQEAKDLFSENHKMLIKGIRWHKWKRYTVVSDWKTQYCQKQLYHPRQSTDSV